MSASLLLLGGLACTGKVDTTDTRPDDWLPPGGGVITLDTRDGVALEADYYPASTAGRPAVVLLHMIPPSNDRTGWPGEFIALLTERDWSVIALDRRGAGGSEGDAVDAYEGEAGKYDVEAAALKLAADGAGALSLIGASNGTTSLLDYAVWAQGEGLPEVVAAGFMTGGSYTEEQNPMSAMPQVPSIFTYSDTEDTWSEAQESLDPGSWSFNEYAGGAHGTRMFDAKPEVADDLVGFFDAAL